MAVGTTSLYVPAAVLPPKHRLLYPRSDRTRYMHVFTAICGILGLSTMVSKVMLCSNSVDNLFIVRFSIFHCIRCTYQGYLWIGTTIYRAMRKSWRPHFSYTHPSFCQKFASSVWSGEMISQGIAIYQFRGVAWTHKLSDSCCCDLQYCTSLSTYLSCLL